MTERITAKEYQNQRAKSGTKRVKGAKRTVVDGIEFDSMREAKRYCTLLLLEKSGEISGLKCQVPFLLMGAEDYVRTPTGRPMRYIADFVYQENGQQVIEDAKGYQTEVSQIKLAIMKAMGLEVKLV